MQFATSTSPLLAIGVMALAIMGCGDSNGGGSAQVDSDATISAADTPQRLPKAKGGGRRASAVPQGRPDLSSVASAVDAYYDAIARGDVAGMCSGMTAQARRLAAQAQDSKSCEEALAAFRVLAQSSRSSPAVTVKHVKTNGDVAIATIAIGSNKTRTRLIQEGDSWLFDSAAKQ